MKRKRISAEAYGVNKQTIYIATKSTNQTRSQYVPEPTRGYCENNTEVLWLMSKVFSAVLCLTAWQDIITDGANHSYKPLQHVNSDEPGESLVSDRQQVDNDKE